MIQEGLLWFDNDPGRGVADKVVRATARYQHKYGHSPDVCYVHPAALTNCPAQVSNVKVLPSPTVLLHHFWLGVEASSVKKRRVSV
jgi:hypothetical protein